MLENRSGKGRPAAIFNSTDRSQIAASIQVEMARRGLTQAKLAELSAYDERTIRNVLKGLPVRDRTIYEICGSLGLDAPNQRSDAFVPPLGAGGSDLASIAVLPFSNLCQDAHQDYFVDGLVDDIITELSRFSELLVVARNSTFQFKDQAIDIRRIGRALGAYYVVEGSVRRAATKVRVTAQLIDAETGTHLWAETFERDMDDVFEVQAGIAQAIASVLPSHVIHAEESRTQAKPTERWQAYDYYLQGARFLATYPRIIRIENIIEARKLLEQALKIDPYYARAFAALSATHVATWMTPMDGNRLKAAELDRAYELAQTGVQLDPNLPQARAQLGNVLIYRHEHDASLQQFDRARTLNPNYCDWRWPAAVMLSGDPIRAIDILEQHALRDPFYEPRALVCLGLAYFLIGKFSDAVIPLREAVLRAPDYLVAHIHLVAACSQLGALGEARSHAQEVLRLEPAWTISSRLTKLPPFRRPEDREIYASSVRLAGLPE